MPSVYLGGAIEGLSIEEAAEWRETATKFFSDAGISTIDPCRRKKFHDEPYSENLARRIVQLDTIDIERADLVFCNLLVRGSGKAWGSVMELVIAKHLNKTTITILEEGFEHPFIRVFSTELHRSLRSGLVSSLRYFN